MGMAPIISSAASGYSGSLLTADGGQGSDVFLWRVEGAKPAPGQEIGHVKLLGCWRAEQVVSVIATDRQGRQVATSLHRNGPKANIIETADINDGRLPLDVRVTFKDKFGVGPNLASLFVKTGGGRDAGVNLSVLGPTCEPPYDGETFEAASNGELKLSGITDKAFVNVNSSIRFDALGATLAPDLSAVRVFRNGVEIPKSSLGVVGNGLLVSAPLRQGRNRLVVLALDTSGKALTTEVTLWAGLHAMNVWVYDENGAPANGAQVSALLGDDPSVKAEAVVVNGVATFRDLPNWTMVLRASATGNRFATVATHGSAANITLRLLGFSQPSDIANNDFSQGTAGWNIGSSPVDIIPHVEAGGGSTQMSRIGVASVARDMDLLYAPPRAESDGVGTPAYSPLAIISADIEDLDLRLNTSGIGPEMVSRAIAVAPGTSSVMARFRFITSEIPGGYFGTQYNDYYSVSIRSASGGGANISSNSMNALGLGAFDPIGATGWYEVSLPVDVAGDTLQIDIVVANVADGAFDSQVIIDFVAEEQLRVTSDLDTACPNETITFQPEGAPTGTIAWSNGGAPATGTGSQFPTRFAATGDYTVDATLTNGAQTQTASKDVHINESSGAAWVVRFPTSVSTGDLVAPFQANVDNFIAAMRAAGATVTISATLRPVERAYLMHYAHRIAQANRDPATVPAQAGVDICWVHRDANGNVDLAASQAAAQAMVNAYNIVFAPALQSRHTQGRAIDMNVSWANNLTMTDASGAQVVITSTPRTGAGNTDLHAVGQGYGVLKLLNDRPHWSDDGH